MAWVYKFIGQKNKVLYVGLSEKADLESRFRGHRGTEIPYSKITRIEYTEVNPMDAELLETVLINYYVPAYNKKKKFEDRSQLFPIMNELPEVEWQEWTAGDFTEGNYSTMSSARLTRMIEEARARIKKHVDENQPERCKELGYECETGKCRWYENCTMKQQIDALKID